MIFPGFSGFFGVFLFFCDKIPWSGFMYGLLTPWDWCIYLLMYHTNRPNVAKYTSPMDPMGTTSTPHPGCQLQIKVFKGKNPTKNVITLVVTVTGWRVDPLKKSSFRNPNWIGRDQKLPPIKHPSMMTAKGVSPIRKSFIYNPEI